MNFKNRIKSLVCCTTMFLGANSASNAMLPPHNSSFSTLDENTSSNTLLGQKHGIVKPEFPLKNIKKYPTSLKKGDYTVYKNKQKLRCFKCKKLTIFSYVPYIMFKIYCKECIQEEYVKPHILKCLEEDDYQMHFLKRVIPDMLKEKHSPVEFYEGYCCMCNQPACYPGKFFENKFYHESCLKSAPEEVQNGAKKSIAHIKIRPLLREIFKMKLDDLNNQYDLNNQCNAVKLKNLRINF